MSTLFYAMYVLSMVFESSFVEIKEICPVEIFFSPSESSLSQVKGFVTVEVGKFDSSGLQERAKYSRAQSFDLVIHARMCLVLTFSIASRN